MFQCSWLWGVWFPPKFRLFCYRMPPPYWAMRLPMRKKCQIFKLLKRKAPKTSTKRLSLDVILSFNYHNSWHSLSCSIQHKKPSFLCYSVSSFSIFSWLGKFISIILVFFCCSCSSILLQVPPQTPHSHCYSQTAFSLYLVARTNIRSLSIIIMFKVSIKFA